MREGKGAEERREGDRKHTGEEMGGKETGLLQTAGLEIAFKSTVSVTLSWHASWSGLTRNSWLTHTKNSFGLMKYQILDSR